MGASDPMPFNAAVSNGILLSSGLEASEFFRFGFSTRKPFDNGPRDANTFAWS
jgi:hypothetical protein